MKNDYPKKRKPKNKEIVDGTINIWQITNQTNPIDVLGSYHGTSYSNEYDDEEQDIDYM